MSAQCFEKYKLEFQLVMNLVEICTVLFLSLSSSSTSITLNRVFTKLAMYRCKRCKNDNIANGVYLRENSIKGIHRINSRLRSERNTKLFIDTLNCKVILLQNVHPFSLRRH